MTSIEIRQVDYANAQQAADLVMLLNAYAQDPMGGGKPLDEAVLERLPTELGNLPNAFSLIAYVDEKPAGLINCYFGFSTFAARKLVNIHDVTVLPDFRGMGLSQMMLARVEQIARENNCSKLTLEVLTGNRVAMNAYKKMGYKGYEVDEASEYYLFWEKKL